MTSQLKPYCVTLEYNACYHNEVAVMASSVEEAIKLAYEEDSDAWRSYDDCGDTYVGHIAEHDTIDDAENAYGHQGDGLPIPFKDMSDDSKLEAVTKAARAMLAALEAAHKALPSHGASAELKAVTAAIAAAKAAGIEAA